MPLLQHIATPVMWVLMLLVGTLACKPPTPAIHIHLTVVITNVGQLYKSDEWQNKTFIAHHRMLNANF